MAKRKTPDPNCRISDVLDIFRGRWKGEIVALLRDETLRFTELRRRIPGASARTLTENLRGLERDGVLIREQFAEVPPHVEYSLSGYGDELLPLLDRIREWGEQHLGCVEACRAAYDAKHAG
ncbi:MAG: helix-turn-helix domain-containing protein [Planctomycetota bacterium]